MNLFHTSSVASPRSNPVWIAACTVAVVVIVLVYALRPSAEVHANPVNTSRAVFEHEPLALVLQQAAEPLKSRVCGQPAVDGYMLSPSATLLPLVDCCWLW